MKVKFLMVIGITLLFSCLAASANAETLRLTLEEAIALGTERSKDLKVKRSAVLSAQAAVASAKAARYPDISSSVTWTHLFDQPKSSAITIDGLGEIPASYTAPSDPVSISTDLNQTIFTFGKINNAIRIAEESLRLAEVELEEEKRRLTIEIGRAFYGYILAEEVLAVQAETLRHKRDAYDVAQKRYRAGLDPEYEVLRAESDWENFKPQVISAQNQVEFALLVVKDLLGIEEEGDFSIELIGTLESEEFTFDKKKLLDTALSKKFEVVQYNASIALQKYQRAITASANKPTIAGFASYELISGVDSVTGENRYTGEDAWDDDLTMGLIVQIPLSAFFPWSKETADRKKEDFDLEQLIIGKDSLESKISLNIESILLKLDEERSMIASVRKGVELAQRLYRSSRERYEKGLASSLELTDAQIGLNEARRGYLQSLYSYKTALFDLMDAVGVDRF